MGRHLARISTVFLLLYVVSFPAQVTAQVVRAKPLNYVEFTTAGAMPGQTLPLIIALHGYGDTPQNFSRMWRAFPGPARFIVFQAPRVKGPGFSWFTVKRPLTLSQYEVTHEIIDAAMRISRQTQSLMKAKPTVGRPIVTGFSQGGILSLTIGLLHGDIFAAAVPLAGMLPTRLPNLTKPIAPMTAFHGEADTVVPWSGLKRSVKLIQKRGGRITTKTYPGVKHWISEAMRYEIFSVIQTYIDVQSK